MIFILAYSQEGKFLQNCPLETVNQLIAEGGKVWIDLEEPTDDERNELIQTFSFTQQSLEEVKQFIGTPKLDLYDHYGFMILHRIFYNFELEQCEKREFEVFFSDHLLVTTHGSHLARIFGMSREKVRERPKKFFSKGAQGCLVLLLDLLIKDYLPVLELWKEQLDEIEEKVMKRSEENLLDQIFQFKKLVATLRKDLIPQRKLIESLTELGPVSFFNPSRNSFKTILENLNSLMHEIDVLREHTISVFDVYAAVLTLKMTESSNQLNFVMQRLTIATTIFMPLTFVVGVYGMNFEHMPELSWKWGYYGVWGVMVGVTLLLIFFFKKKKWL